LTLASQLCIVRKDYRNGENLPPIKNWEKPIPLEEVDVEKIAKKTGFSQSRILEALVIEDRDIFAMDSPRGRSLEKDFLRMEWKKLNRAHTEGEALAFLRGYQARLENSPSLAPYDTPKLPSREIQNIYIWYFAHRYRLSTKSAK
jgi:hypothetical protein